MQLVHARRSFFFFNDTATTEIYTLSLHDALPISLTLHGAPGRQAEQHAQARGDLARRLHRLRRLGGRGDLAQARSEEHTSELQSANISYAVFCLKKKTNKSDRRPL